jgi:P-type Ca2+ transporter type 2C
MNASATDAKPHARPAAQVCDALKTDPRRGLPAGEARSRLLAHGENLIRRAEGRSPWPILAAQFRSVVVGVLIGAALVSALLGERLDAGVILAIVILNAAIGFFQEYRAERAVAALARMTAPHARVIRAGAVEVIAASEVVPGDLLLLEAGDIVAADARLVEASALRTNEAALTGESEPVEKSAVTLDADTALADRANMIFLGTSVAAGTGRAIVTATAMATEFGRIAQMLAAAEKTVTPLERRLDEVGRQLLWACLAIVALVFALGLLRAVPLYEMFLGAVSLAVAAIPEGLPAIVTVALALGVTRMAARNALVRKLHSVETLGSAQIICTDKTGTLTVGQMTARRIVTASEILEVSGEGYAPEGAITTNGEERTAAGDPVLHDLLRCAAACNEAHLVRRDGAWTVAGDPTEGALLTLAAKGGIAADAIDSALPRIGAIPFSAARKRMTIVRRCGAGAQAFVKGAPEVILERCTRMRSAGGVVELGDGDRSRMLEAVALMAGEALRVIACAERTLAGLEGDPAAAADQIERELTLLGLVGLQDPPRAEAREAVRRCRRAGIRIVMITGDHPATAHAIARELEILGRGQQVMDGTALERTPDAELPARIENVTVFARVTAEHKLRIVRAFRARGAVVAMTGDGVNDAPALKEASIGIAMGIAGTEVTKEAADLVIADDDFASIVAAVEEGRGIYDNIAKTLAYLMGGNAGEMLVMFIAGLAGWPLPLLPAQLLWINLVTDGLPALALATDPIDPAVLNEPPRPAKTEIIDRAFIARLALTGVLSAAVTLAAFAYELHAGRGERAARSAAFFVLVAEELLRSFGARSTRRMIWEISVLSNLRLMAIVGASFALQLLITQMPALQIFFGTAAVSPLECIGRVMLGVVPLCVLQAVQLAGRAGVKTSAPR